MGARVPSQGEGIIRCLTILSLALFFCSAPAHAARQHVSTAQLHRLRGGVAWQRTTAWRSQDRAYEARTRTVYAERHTRSPAYIRWIAQHWKHIRAEANAKAARLARLIPHRGLWLCIHRGEGAWNDPNAPFYGGLQMTSPWGTGVYYVERADWLSPWEQMRKAELGYIASGHSISWLRGQWPNTSPPCLGYA
jgi:hypothetical protein